MTQKISPLASCILGATVLLLGSCSTQNSTWNDYLQMVRQAVGGSFSKRGITREQAAAIPYASLGYRINGGNENLLVLATDSNGETLWTSSSHIVLMMRGGRVIRSVGLPRNIRGLVQANGGDLPELKLALGNSYRSLRQIDLPDIGAFGLTLNCVATPRGSQVIRILGTSLPTRRVDETCRTSGDPQWTFTDSYWIDAQTGFVWRSIQHLHPAGTIIEIEILRPPG